MAYLADRQIKTVPTLALIAKDEAALERVLIQPLMSGWRNSEGGEIKLAEIEKPIAEAVLRHMWALCHQEWAAQQAPDPAVAPSAASATPATKSGGEEKVPKQLPSGVWAQLIRNYESQQIQGQDRTFPIPGFTMSFTPRSSSLRWGSEKYCRNAPSKPRENLTLSTGGRSRQPRSQ